MDSPGMNVENKGYEKTLLHGCMTVTDAQYSIVTRMNLGVDTAQAPELLGRTQKDPGPSVWAAGCAVFKVLVSPSIR